MKYIIKLLVVAGALLLAQQLVSGFSVDSFWPTAVLAAFVFGLLSITVEPILKLFALPITVLTLGLFGLVVNILVFWMLTWMPGVSIDGFMSAMWALIIVSICGWIADAVLN
ncbi:MAG: phage holin family protein [Patescibacteria group bacterium]